MHLYLTPYSIRSLRAALHAANIIHGNLEPSNFLYVRGNLCLIDFGSSSRLGRDNSNSSKDGEKKFTLVKHDTINLDYAACETVNDYMVSKLHIHVRM